MKQKGLGPKFEVKQAAHGPQQAERLQIFGWASTEDEAGGMETAEI